MAIGSSAGARSQLMLSGKIKTFLTRSFGFGIAQLGPDWLGHMLGHQGVLGLDLREGVGHDHQEKVQLLLREEVRRDSGDGDGLLTTSAGCSPTQPVSVCTELNNYQGWILTRAFLTDNVKSHRLL